MKTQVQLIDAKNAGPKKIYLELLPGDHSKKGQEYYDQDVTDKCMATYGKAILFKIFKFNIMVLFFKIHNLMK